MKENNNRNLLLGVTFIDLLGFGILLPIMPFLALELHATSFQIGMLAASFAFFQMLFMPFWGHCADKLGARPILIISMLGTAISFFLFATSSSYWGLMGSRILAGATSATLGVVRGSLTLTEDKAETQKNMRLFGAAQGLGFLFGPMLGALMQGISLRAPIWAAFIISALMVPFLLKTKKFSRTIQSQQSSFTTKVKKIASNKELSSLAGTYFFIYLAFAFLFISFPLFLKDAYNYGAKESAIYFSILAISAVIGQILLLPVLQKKYSNALILLISLLVLPLEIKILSLPFSGVTTGAILSVTSICLFIALTSLMTEIGFKSTDDEKNLVAASTESLSGLARLGGTAISGFVIEKWNIYKAFDTSASIILLALVTFYLANKLHKR
ncbi:MAG: MFS transporter [Pseudobdellovibrionaceae bacterium]